MRFSLILLLWLLYQVDAASWCTFTGCAVGRCSCPAYVSTCVTQDDANGLCTPNQAGIWLIAGLCFLLLVVVVLVIVCVCCFSCCCCPRCCRRGEKKYSIVMPREPEYL